MNDIVQWICVAIILGIAAYSVIKKIIRQARSRRDGSPEPGCGCGCAGCALSADCDPQRKRQAKKKR